MDSAWLAVLAGIAAGSFNGALSRWALKRTLGSADAIFYSVFAGGLFYRLCFLAAAVWLLRSEKYIIVVLFTLSLIAVQVVFEVIPLKRNGTKRNP